MSKCLETMCNKYLPLGGFPIRAHPSMYPILNCNPGTFSQPFHNQNHAWLLHRNSLHKLWKANALSNPYHWYPTLPWSATTGFSKLWNPKHWMEPDLMYPNVAYRSERASTMSLSTRSLWLVKLWGMRSRTNSSSSSSKPSPPSFDGNPGPPDPARSWRKTRRRKRKRHCRAIMALNMNLLSIFNRWHTSRKILQSFHHG